MKRFNIIILILMAFGAYGLAALSARADIYSWTDENGVNHFTNYAPPKHAKLLMKTPEIPYDEEADIQRRETDRLEAARQELAEREAFLIQEQQAAERRIAEANARAEAALWEANRVLREAEAAAEDTDYDRSSDFVYGAGVFPHWRFNHHRRVSRHSRLIRDYRYSRYPGYYHKNYYPAYWHERPYKKHYSTNPKRHVNRRHSAVRSRNSHRSRTAAFRGKHGRF